MKKIDPLQIQSYYDTLIADLKEAQHLDDGSEYGLKVALYELEHAFADISFYGGQR